MLDEVNGLPDATVSLKTYKRAENVGQSAMFLPYRETAESCVAPSSRRQHYEIKPEWSWFCSNHSCERILASEATTLQSLVTCSRLCGSTQLWPQPTGTVSLATAAIPIGSDKITLTIAKSPSQEVIAHLEDAFALMKEDLKLLERDYPGRNITAGDVTVRVAVDGSADPRLLINTDESYNISLRPFSNNSLIADISAKTFCGARHGFETLFQLIWMDPYAGSLFIIKEATIEDAPKFKYRGLLLDTARNYFPVKDIMRTIDAMGAVKLNTFHWHISDSQSFPLKLKRVPQLAQHGAYGAKAIYTHEDVKAIVRRARLRGVRVLIEIDTPAHVGRAWTWGPDAGLGHLALCVEAEPWATYCGEPPCGQLNPQNPHVYILLEQIYAEIIELTGVDDIFHLGGDEVSEACWLEHFNGSYPMSLWINFTRNALDSLKIANGGKLPELTLLWSSGLTTYQYLDYLDPKKLGIQIWGASDWPESRFVLDSGYRSVLSHVNAWYLDCGFGSWRDSSDGPCDSYRSWQQVYDHRPWAETLFINPSIIKPGIGAWRIEGGAACLWTEQTGPESLDVRLWPRTAALAERLWSDSPAGATLDVYVRLDTMRTRLLAKGIRAAPLWSHWCTLNPSFCFNPPPPPPPKDYDENKEEKEYDANLENIKEYDENIKEKEVDGYLEETKENDDNEKEKQDDAKLKEVEEYEIEKEKDANREETKAKKNKNN
ncbi:glycosyl hydrolase family 20, catalytic domain-containing protein [Phthorimaea operculella]|nr:glycosyl hydrolase family 20, catalytic domain-containing protein [Phthorimaea operculella]